jgi:hypothetical protein
MLNNGRNWFLQGLVRAAQRGPIGLELYQAITALRWGIYMILPATFLSNNTSATMSLMSNIVSAHVWFCVFILLTLAQVYVMMRTDNGTRKNFALFGFFWWTFITLLDFTAGMTTATINIGLFAFNQLIIYVLLTVFYEPVEEKL